MIVQEIRVTHSGQAVAARMAALGLDWAGKISRLKQGLLQD